MGTTDTSKSILTVHLMGSLEEPVLVGALHCPIAGMQMDGYNKSTVSMQLEKVHLGASLTRLGLFVRGYFWFIAQPLPTRGTMHIAESRHTN